MDRADGLIMNTEFPIGELSGPQQLWHVSKLSCCVFPVAIKTIGTTLFIPIFLAYIGLMGPALSLLSRWIERMGLDLLVCVNNTYGHKVSGFSSLCMPFPVSVYIYFYEIQSV